MSQPSSDVSPAAVKEHAAALAALRKGIQEQQVLREVNLQPVRPDEAALSRLDSSIKKNAAFIKRLRQLSADSCKQLLDDIKKLNLSKYVTEAVAAIADATLKAQDVAAAVEVCSALHQRYPDFATALGPALVKPFASSSLKAAPEEERVLLRRQRAALRLLPELLLAGVHQDSGPLLGVVKQLASLDFAADKDAAAHAISLLGMLGKGPGPQLLGLPPTAAAPLPEGLLQQDTAGMAAELAEAVQQLQQEQQSLAEALQGRWRLPQAERASLGKLLVKAFEAGCTALTEAHAALNALDQENARVLATRLVLPEGAAEQYEAQRKAYEALHRSVSSLAEGLNRPMPNLVEDAFTRLKEDGTPAAGSSGGAGQDSSAAAEQVFEDPEARAFYEQLPDLRALVPAVLLQDAPGGNTPGQQGGPSASSSRRMSDAGGGDAAAAGAAAAADEVAVDAAEVAAAVNAEEEGAAAAAAGAAAGQPATGADAASAAADPSSLDLVLQRLPSCVTRELADELAVNFCYCNSKSARKRLVKVLVAVPRGSLQLLPYYARVAATISQIYPDVGKAVLANVEAQFDVAFASNSTAAVEPRIRVVRYLAELTKFRIAPPGPVMLRLKQLLDDFTGTSVDAAAALVESAGRFLLRLPESKVRMENLLAVLMRLRNVKNLDNRQAALVDSAYFATCPPDKAAARRRRRPPQQEYIRHLLFERLSDGSIVEVLKKLMKLPWAECEPYVLKCLLKVVRVRFSHIPLIASLAGGLAQYHDTLGVALVDSVLEEVRWALDHPAAGRYQHLLAEMRLLGELYNYMLLDSRAVFDVLYTLLGHGHATWEQAARLDPPDEYFRLRMVIALLNTCGVYFSKGTARRRLDRFLTFLSAYVAAKDPLPLDIENDLLSMLGTIRPGFQLHATYAEAAAEVASILAKEAAAAARGLPTIDEEDDNSDEEEDEEEAAQGSGQQQGSREDAGSKEDVAMEELDEYDRGEATVSKEDDEFEREFQALMAESLGRPAAPLPFPAGGVPNVGSQPQQFEGMDDEEEAEAAPTVTMKFLVRRQGGSKEDKPRELQVPATAGLAQRLLQQQESEAAERSAIKALVLEANQREQQQGMRGSAPPLVHIKQRPVTAGRGGGGGGRGGHHGRGRGERHGGRSGSQA